VFVTLHDTFIGEGIIKYSETVRLQQVDETRHSLIREALILTDVHPSGLEIASMSDIPAGTGLGPSGSFTTALLGSLHTTHKSIVTKYALAEQACHIETDLAKEPVGKQDQYIAAFGGVTCFEFLPDDRVQVSTLQLRSEALANLEDNLLFFFTGYTRSASQILADQDRRTRSMDQGNDRQSSFREGAWIPEQECAEGGKLTQVP